MRKLTLIAAAALLAVLADAGTATAAEHHPPKFGVHDTQCVGDNNQPNCPGIH